MTTETLVKEDGTLSPSDPVAIVGIGASAGGLEALELFFDAIPSTTGMGFVVIQHLSPTHKSLMAELLADHTDMKVKKAAHGERVLPDSVYLIPPEKNLRIENGELRLIDREGMHEINLPIDLFLSSLAIDRREKAIGVILSGTGSDGRRGIESIKQNGGFVFVQEESSAKFDGMPRAAISTGMADYVQTPKDIAKTLKSLASIPRQNWTSPGIVISPEDSGFDRIMAILRDRTNVDFTFYKLNTVTRRIERRMQVNQIESLEAYVRYMEQSIPETKLLYQELLIGVTGFFRDPEVFDKLQSTWFPTLFKQHKKTEYRIWVAGCSTGQEAYSLSILAHECIQAAGIASNIKVFATDLDKESVAEASIGNYPAASISEIPEPLFEKYFTQDDEGIRVTRKIRESIVFAQHNLVRDPPFTNIDFVSCRNLLIYLQPILQLKTLEMLNFSLNRGGLLILGSSETTGEMADYFETLDTKSKIFRCKGRHRITTPFSMSSSSNVQINEDSAPASYYRGTTIRQRVYEDRVMERVTAKLAVRFFLCALVVRENMELLHVLGTSEGFLSIPVGKLQNNLDGLIRKELRIPVTSGIQRALGSGIDCRFNRIALENRDNTQFVDVEIFRLDERNGEESLLLLVLNESQDLNHIHVSPSGEDFDVGRETENHVRNLESELEFTRENLQATIEELETSNEELQATNEELLASNEELQSTNEELQSVNEELYTVNAEYQTKINELTELTNDLDNLLSSTQVATIFLDENLEIRRYTRDAAQIFEIFGSDIGRPIGHLRHHIERVDLLNLLAEVQSSHCSYEQEVTVRPNGWYLMRIIPYSISPRIYSGIIITFIDITHYKRVENDLTETEAIIDFIREIPEIGIVTMSDNGVMESTNAVVESMFGYRPDDLLGKNFSMLLPEPYRAELSECIRKYLHGDDAKAIGCKRELVALKKTGDQFPILLLLNYMNISGSRQFVGLLKPLDTNCNRTH